LLAGNRASGQCPVYPIALSYQTVANAAEGNTLPDVWIGSQPGQFGWLSWTGDPGEPALVDSLTQPGDSNTDVNPDDPTSHELVPGVWASGRPGVANGKHVRAALDALKNVVIMVPVWDQSRGDGANVACHIAGFANIQITSYQLPSQNRITAVFLGFTGCGIVTSVPARKAPRVLEVAQLCLRN